jgi:hypothetical protein
MHLTRSILNKAVTAGVLDAKGAADLWDLLLQMEWKTPLFKSVHPLYCLGVLIAIGAMPMSTSIGRSHFGGSGHLTKHFCIYTYGRAYFI